MKVKFEIGSLERGAKIDFKPVFFGKNLKNYPTEKSSCDHVFQKQNKVLLNPVAFPERKVASEND